MSRYLLLCCGSLAALLAFGACVYPVIEYDKETTASNSTTSASGGGANGGGNPASGTTSSGSGTGGTGAGGPACALHVQGDCGSGKKCSVTDTTTGEVGCVDAGPRPAYSFCLNDVECEEGTWCDEATFTCHPVCQSGNDCDVSGAQCIQGIRVLANMIDTEDIPGLKLCTAHCDPKSAKGCEQGFGSTTCVYVGIDFDCAGSNDQTEGLPCSFLNDCAIGLRCSGSPASCEPWCQVGMDLCGATTSCCSLSPSVNYDGDEYGICC